MIAGGRRRAPGENRKCHSYDGCRVASGILTLKNIVESTLAANDFQFV